jgi:hypothetical protein
MARATPTRRKSKQRKVIAMSIRQGGTGITEKPEHNPFAALWTTDINAAWQKSLKPLLSSVLDTNEKLSKEVLAWYERAMSWTKGTPWAPLCKTFVTSFSKIVEDTNSLVRSAWHIEHARDGPDTIAKS